MNYALVILARHHTRDELIALSEVSEHWHALAEEEWPSDGEVPLFLRDTMAVRGSYHQVETARYYAYWSAAGDFCFRDNADRIFRLFHRAADGNTMAYGDVRASLAPAIAPNGCIRPGFFAFDLSIDAHPISHIEYKGELFRALYRNDITPFAERTLGSWDFFAGVTEAVEALREEVAGKQPSPTDLSRAPAIGSLLPALLLASIMCFSGSVPDAVAEPRVGACQGQKNFYTIQRHEQRALTICPDDAPPECHTDRYLKAYEHFSGDLDGDRRPDLIVEIQSGLVGIAHSLSYYAVFMACADGRYQRVLFSAFSTVEAAEQPSGNTPATLRVSRVCHDPSSGSFFRREYTVNYHLATGNYGPPNDDEGLRDFCGAYELSLPHGTPERIDAAD